MPKTPIPLPQVRTVGLMQPMTWLVLAWRDMARSGWISFAHGLAITAFGGAILAVAHHRFWLLAGAFSGFLLVAPVLAVGLYAVSRALERGETVGFALVLRTWLSWRGQPRHDWRLVRFGLLLAAAGTGWVLTSASLISRACASVLMAMNSTPLRPCSIMRLTALTPPPPMPTTLMTAR